MRDKEQMKIIFKVQENQHKNFHQIKKEIRIDNICQNKKTKKL